MFGDLLSERLAGAAVLVAVISPRYLRSEWCQRELNEFLKATDGGRADGKPRLFTVLKTPVPLEQMPPQLRQMLRYEFFTVDPASGDVREFDEVFGAEAQRDFWLKLDDLAHDICNVLGTPRC